MRNRSVVFVIRNKKILVEKLNYPSEGKDDFYSIPGGGIEDAKLPNRLQSANSKKNADLMNSQKRTKPFYGVMVLFIFQAFMMK